VSDKLTWRKIIRLQDPKLPIEHRLLHDPHTRNRLEKRYSESENWRKCLTQKENIIISDTVDSLRDSRM
jgi:hypothetical protein